MPIRFYEEEKLFKLDTPGSTAVLQIYDEGYLLGLYYGAPIPDMHFDNFTFRDYFASFCPRNENLRDRFFSPDVFPIEYSGFGTGDFRPAAVAIRNADGNDCTDFRYESYVIRPGKPKLEGLPATYVTDERDAETLEITMLDRTTGAAAILSYTVFETESVIARSVRIENRSERPMDIEKVSSVSLNLPDADYDFIHLWGRWAAERNLQRTPLRHGQQSVSSVRGSSSHFHNPFAALARRGADEDHGEVYGVNLVYSGNFDITVDVDSYETLRLNAGIAPAGFLWHLLPGESFQTPEAVTVFTTDGLGEMSRIFHRLYLHNLIRGRYKTERRPVLINAWEGCFFDFDDEKMVSFAARAAEMGFEMLVMDDGWFGHRDGDDSSLGDWFVYKDKIRGGLGPMIERIRALGLKFGIWFEPEMISPDSKLYQAHPDWCLRVPGRPNSIARNQYVLDMTREDVRDNIFEQMRKILSENDIAYVKWDFNRNLTEAGSACLPAERGEEIFHRFVLGTYSLLERLLAEFPDLLIEGCSGGGGRFDPGMLYYTPQIWTSDNTDPIERLAIQFGTSLCYPASAMGAHVAKCPRTGYETKGNIALWGTFGCELDPNTLTEEEKTIIRGQVADYHRFYDLLHYGDLYRVTTPFENAFRCAWEMVSPDKREMLFTNVTMRFSHNRKYIVRFKGLNPALTYRLEETGEEFSGAFLMNAGLNLGCYPFGDGESFRLYFTADR